MVPLAVIGGIALSAGALLALLQDHTTQAAPIAIQTNLAAAVIESIPEDWFVAELVLGPTVADGETVSMSHELSHPSLSTGLTCVVPNDQV